MNGNAKIGSINKEQKKVIDDLEEVLSFLKSAQIEDEDVLTNIKKPLTDLRSSFKFILTWPYFEKIPTEITTRILNYLCDSNVFTAFSVCVGWKDILGSRFTEKTVTIGRRCCISRCTDNMCLVKSEMLKAAATHKMDVHLVIRDSVREVDSKLLIDALTSVAGFSFIGNCSCDNSYLIDECECEVNPLSNEQLGDLFKGLEKRWRQWKRWNFECLDLTELNQDRLVHCLVNKIKNLRLVEGGIDNGHHGRMLNIETFLNKLSQESVEFKLSHLTLSLFCPEELTFELANAVCNVENVKLFSISLEAVTQLIDNILTDTRPVMIKSLFLRSDFRTVISPEDLKRLYNKMTKLYLNGHFTLEQMEAVRSIPGVRVWGVFETFIEKG